MISTMVQITIPKSKSAITVAIAPTIFQATSVDKKKKMHLVAPKRYHRCI